MTGEMTEDEFLQELIEHERTFQKQNYDEISIEPEAHYNYYGTRGVADLYVRKQHTEGTIEARVYEIKSTHAIAETTGANEITRQFNKMRDFFFQDESRTLADDIMFELLFIPSPKAFAHVGENSTIYTEVANSSSAIETEVINVRSLVGFRHFDRGPSAPLRITHPCDFSDPDSVDDFLDKMGPDGERFREYLFKH